MRLQGHEALRHQRSEVLKLAAFKTTHDVYHLLRQLERCLLHSNALAWRITQQKTKVYVYNMPFNVH